MSAITTHAAPGAEPVRNPFATGVDVPWCNGCSYIALNAKIQDALAARYDVRDVVLVSDIGCIGIVDKLYACDTVHGLHGRSVTLAAGLKMAHANPALKVIVFIGDGGASIGLQNLLDAARLNADLTVFAFDNQNYGMTGGQHSTFTLPDVKTVTTPQGSTLPANDLVRLLGAYDVFRARLTANDARVPAAIEQALAHPGFAYVETLNFCSSYAGRMNPGLALARAQRFCEASGREFGVWEGGSRPPFAFHGQPPLRETLTVRGEAPAFAHGLRAPLRLVLGGSAGGGVQSAAGVFTRAAVLSGLHVSLKSDYPVTVGKGHSTCEVILSPRPILFAGIARPQLAIVCTEDGRRALAPLIAAAEEVVYHAALGLEGGTALDFQRHGARNAPFAALAEMLATHGWFPLAALRRAVGELPNAQRRAALLGIVDAVAGEAAPPA